MCGEQLKSNSSEQVFSSNDLSLLSISLLTTSCRGRDGQGQTQPRQKDRRINRQEGERTRKRIAKEKSQCEREDCKMSGRYVGGNKSGHKNAESPCSHYIREANMTESCKSQRRRSLAFLTLPLSDGLVTSRFLFQVVFIFLSSAQNMVDTTNTRKY